MQATARTDFQHLPRVLQGEDEDSWFGITDPKIRRRLQNRLNQRERRKRLRASDTSSNQLEQQLGPGAESANHIDRILRILDAIRILGPAAINAAAVLKQLESAIVFGARCNAWSPAADLRLGVTRLNVLRALHANLEVLGYRPSDIEDDAQSTFTVERPSRHPDRDIIEAKLPSALRPTVIQRTIPHHPWLDLIPFPCMRDTLILAQDFIDDEQLCQDMSGRGSPVVQQSNLDAGIGETGILVWKDPWDPSGWEVTQVFIQRWGWTLRNCPELLRSTNAWRRYRGERPLFTVSENDMESVHARILEIGAGTGGATDPVLEGIGTSFSSYTYTDVIYQVLDIEEASSNQGYVPHSDGTLIASNVLHATASLQRTLENTQQLLKAGGYLVLLGLTNSGTIRVSNVMGGLPGWWLEVDKGPKYTPVMNPGQWGTILRKAGFGGIVAILPAIDPKDLPFSITV
ncbi:hypothetical protein IFM62136_07709 [Aspergillus lentulus]|nr:hypothetical protein IFM62136_07709 [Aspergillus lentulus]